MQFLQKLHKMLTLGLLFLVVIGWFYLTKLEQQRDTFLSDKEFLDLQLKQLVILTSSLQREKYLKNGEVRTRTRFLPPEGNTTITVGKDSKVTTKIKTKGLTLRPGIGIAYQGQKLRLLSSNKVFYWGRLGLLINGNRDGLAVGVSRYVDDLIPFWHPKNVELMLSKKVLSFKESSDKLYLGLRISL